MEQTNYGANIISKSLKMGKSNTICLLVSTIQNPIFAEITQGVEDTARKSGYIVVLCNTDEDEAIEREYIENMKTRWVDGFIICSAVNSTSILNVCGEKDFLLLWSIVLIKKTKKCRYGRR